MDYFFAACEELRHPELKDKPLIVGTAPIVKKEKGVIQTCNYVARKYGIHSAMPTIQALKLNPDLVYLESDDVYYEEVSDKVMKLLKSFGFDMEALSIDEAAMDISGKDYIEAELFAKELKKKITDQIGLPCTIGISTGKIFAKIACDSAKPDGLRVLKEEELKQFLSSKKVGALLGVGPKTAERLKSMNITTIGELSKVDPNLLVDAFGSFGRELYLLANCKDESRIETNYTTLSIGRERTMENNTKDIEQINKMLELLSKEVINELVKKEFWFKGISVKAKYYDFTEKIKNKKLTNYTESYEVLYNTAIQLIKDLVRDKDVRKVGVRTYLLEMRKGQKKISI
jgi:nucleotidyltransferase/DNA polymerase involved in DNA repair